MIKHLNRRVLTFLHPDRIPDYVVLMPNFKWLIGRPV